ncbi:MAG: HDIG domain-containing metalloprotein, partial [Planctomycetota bacterium]
MAKFGGKKNTKSWRRLSFSHKQTKASVLAERQSTAHRVTRIVLAISFTIMVSIVVGAGWPNTPKFQIVAGEFQWQQPLKHWVEVIGLVLLVHFGMFLLVRSYHREVLLGVRRFARYFFLVGAFLLCARLLLLAPDISPFLIPLPFLAMSLALIYSGHLANNTSFAVAILLGVMAQMRDGFMDGTSVVPFDVEVVASQFLGSAVAIQGVTRIRTRTRLVTIGFASGAVQMLSITIFQLWGEVSLGTLKWLQFGEGPLWGFVNGLGSGILLTSALPFTERIFDVTTDMRLIELADQNRPVLREFQLLAPGSFQHSLMVGQLAEEAAKSIGANDLLARVGALYHDVGKMMKPNYFVENMNDKQNIHDRLSPEMSRLIIISHVKDGIRIAQEERLPKPIVDMIPMHHGTSLVEYFYQKKRQQEVTQGHSESGEEAFLYPGPKPTFREAGILMLADTTEARSRVLSDPTPTRLRALVRDVIQKKMAEGQLDECELTMHDLSRIEDAFVRVLAAIHHGRIRYPGEEKQPEPQKEGKEVAPREGAEESSGVEGDHRKDDPGDAGKKHESSK